MGDGGADADFDPVSEIGFPLAACAGTITDMPSLIACLACVTEFDVDCVSAAQVPALVVPYPAACE